MLTDRDMRRLITTARVGPAAELDVRIASQYSYTDERWELQGHQFQPVSLDVRLGDITDQDGLPVTDCDWSRDGYEMLPGDFLLGNTIECFRLGRRLWGKVEGKSTRARQGLIVECAGLVDPGFHGTITLELINLGKKPIQLSRGMLIAQIMFGWTNSDPIRAYGDEGLDSHYQGQSAPTPARTS